MKNEAIEMIIIPENRILVVDDVGTNLDLLVDALSGLYKVSVATDGESALRVISEVNPDLILLDVMMPRMDGYEACQQIKQDARYSDIPVIFLTAKSEMEDVVKGFELGAVDYISKPFNIPELMVRVKTHLELKRAREKIEKQNVALIKASQFRDDVDRIIHHDLKTPLSPILSFPNLIVQKENLSEKTIKYLKIIEQAGFRILNMINFSLDMFKMEQGVYKLDPVPVNIVNVIQQITQELDDIIYNRQLSLKADISGEPVSKGNSFIVAGEDLLCYSMLANLVKNALEVSPKNETVAISMEKDEMAKIEIHNWGTVPERIRENFFDKYVTDGKNKGTGLGTYSAKLITQTLKGTIHMTSSDKAGTRVTIELPVQ